VGFENAPQISCQQEHAIIRKEMKMKKNEVEIKCKLEADAVATMLMDLANSFKEGKVVIQKGASFVTLRPAGVIEVEIEAVEKKGKQKIEIQLDWEEEILLDAAEAKINISAQDPVLDIGSVEEAIETKSELMH
jgi:amphi-Trp domain-containing protein